MRAGMSKYIQIRVNMDTNNGRKDGIAVKKWLSVLAALVLLLLAGTVAAEETLPGPEDFRGNWELYSISLMGVTLNRSDLSYNVVCNIHGDDTATFAMREKYFIAPVSYGEGACLLHEGSEATRLTLDAEGMLCLTMTSDGVKMNLRLQRAAASEPAEEIAPLVGRWELDSATAMGLHLSEADTGTVVATIYHDQYGQLQLGGETLGLRLQVDRGAVVMLAEGVRSPVSLDGEGRMVIRWQDGTEGTAITLTLLRVPTAWEATAAQELARFTGVWQAVRTRVMGAEFPLGADALRLEITGETALLVTGGAEHACTVAWSDGACVLETDGVRCRGVIGDDGQMRLAIPVFDVSFILAPQAD